MKTTRHIAFALALLLTGGSAAAQTAGGIQIDQPFSRATPGGAKVGAGYMTIVNKGGADKLVSATTAAADRVEIHEMKMEGSVMKMKEIPGGLPIEAGKSVSLAPGGYHLMLMGLKAPLKEGGKVPVTLTFERAGKLDVTLDVRGIAAQPGNAAPAGGHMHKM